MSMIQLIVNMVMNIMHLNVFDQGFEDGINSFCLNEEWVYNTPLYYVTERKKSNTDSRQIQIRYKSNPQQQLEINIASKHSPIPFNMDIIE